VFKNRVQRRIIERKTEEVAGDCRGSLHVHFIKYPLSLSLLGSTAQLRPWPPPQSSSIKMAEFLGGFLTIFFFKGQGC
jgi:hypothetical protein